MATSLCISARSAAPTSNPVRPAVTVVVPAFNEATRLATTLPVLAAYAQRHEMEIVLVDDGSTDGTAALARSILEPTIGRVVRLPRNAGKGAAVRAGIAAARADAVVFLDADLATELDDVTPLLAGLADHDVVIGSRRVPGAVVTHAAGRRQIGAAFNLVVRSLTGLAIADTQCGCKAFRADAARRVFALAETDGFAFDVEVLLIATRLGLSIDERPVRWHAVAGSKVSRLRDPLRMTADVWRARRRWSSRRTGTIDLVTPTPSLTFS
jgi:glycosyltransferase involved in cell wall biosynthesis